MSTVCCCVGHHVPRPHLSHWPAPLLTVSTWLDPGKEAAQKGHELVGTKAPKNPANKLWADIVERAF